MISPAAAGRTAPLPSLAIHPATPPLHRCRQGSLPILAAEKAGVGQSWVEVVHDHAEGRGGRRRLLRGRCDKRPKTVAG